MNACLSVLSLLSVILNNCLCQVHGETIVRIPKGKIRGHILTSGNGHNYYAFQEIPYAAKPIGRDRFRLPREPEPWNGILNTTRNTVICYQNDFEENKLKIAEDCLYLNIYSPVKPGTKEVALPVAVWIHGGGYVFGSGTDQYYGPKYLIDHGIVVVTVNYRLGPFGFLTTEDNVIPANIGMKDIKLALKFVHDNIGRFGGNRSHVTIAGESSGASAVGILLLGERCGEEELFQAAILQSGSPIGIEPLTRARETAFRVGRKIDPYFSSEESSALLKVLLNASADDILKSNASQEWGTIIEKTGEFSYPGLQALMDGNFKKLPILIGFTSEEAIYVISDPNITELVRESDKNSSKLFLELANVRNRAELGKEMKKLYTNETFEKDVGAYIRLLSDNYLTTPALKQAELESIYTDAYVYQFSYKGLLGGSTFPAIPNTEIVSHAEDLRYMWDQRATNDNLTQFPQTDQLMLQRFVKLWTNFVKYHNPTPEADPLLEKVIWPKVDPTKPEKIQFLNINVTMEVRANPRVYQQVKKLLDANIIPPYIVY